MKFPDHHAAPEDAFKTLDPISRVGFLGENTDDHTRSLVEGMLSLSRLSAEHGKLSLVLSGFVPDLCEGKVLRHHHDLDMVVLAKDIPFFQEQLREAGYEIGFFRSKDPKLAFMAKKGEWHVDIGGIEMTENQVFDDTDPKGRFVWQIKPQEFVWAREIGGERVRFISPKVAYIFKRDAGRNDAKDVQDLHILAKYGLKNETK